jgi:hypothetical protein
VFAPVAWLEVVQLLLALAAYECWAMHHMDVKSVFLNGELRSKSSSSSYLVLFFEAMNIKCCTSSRICTVCVKPHTPSRLSSTSP